MMSDSKERVCLCPYTALHLIAMEQASHWLLCLHGESIPGMDSDYNTFL